MLGVENAARLSLDLECDSFSISFQSMHILQMIDSSLTLSINFKQFLCVWQSLKFKVDNVPIA